MNMNMKDFLDKTHLDKPLVRAVIRRLGGWETAREYLVDVSRYGATAGFPGFTYTMDNIEFYRHNRWRIVKLLEGEVENFDYQDDIIAVVRYFPLFKGSIPSTRDVGMTLYGNMPNDRIAEALAWYALERVADDFVRYLRSLCIRSEEE